MKQKCPPSNFARGFDITFFCGVERDYLSLERGKTELRAFRAHCRDATNGIGGGNAYERIELTLSLPLSPRRFSSAAVVPLFCRAKFKRAGRRSWFRVRDLLLISHTPDRWPALCSSATAVIVLSKCCTYSFLYVFVRLLSSTFRRKRIFAMYFYYLFPPVSEIFQFPKPLEIAFNRM